MRTVYEEIRREAVADLVGAHEIADRCGVTFSAVSKWQARYKDFPEPTLTLTMGKMWAWPEVLEWLTGHGRLSP